MTNEEKRFKILKVEKYNEELEREKINLIFRTFVAGVSAIVATLVIAQNPNTEELLPLIAGSWSAGLSITQLIEIIKSIMKKSSIKKDIAQIEDELYLQEEGVKKR